jgi:hypothetical protein
MRRIRIPEQLRKNRPENPDAQRVDENRKKNDPDRMPLHVARQWYLI